jgi:hypothetical protein
MLGVPAARAPLLALLSTCTDQTLLQHAADILIEIADASCVPALHRLLPRRDVVAGHAALALGRVDALCLVRDDDIARIKPDKIRRARCVPGHAR